MIIRTLLLLIISFIITGCTNEQSDIRLLNIEQCASNAPKEAWDSLGAINSDILSKKDKHYYDFLTVKVADKAYITHSSDSLILKVIDFESKHQDLGRYPEALYYGGRVYSDLGDYPTALQFFHLSLNSLENHKNLELKSRVLSQTGRLLTSMSLYEEAIPYIKEALEIEQEDTIKFIHDLLLLGGTYLRSGSYSSAECNFRKAYYLSDGFSNQLFAKSKMYLAAVKYRTGQLDSAIYFIKDTPYKVNPLIRNSALGYASTIYLDAGALDSAYIYANKLIHSPNEDHKEIGYQVILSPELRNYIQADSLNNYICNYRTLLEEYYDDNMAQLTINQQAFYNYQLHVKRLSLAEDSNKFLIKLIIGFSFILFSSSLIILYLKNRNKSNIIKLQNALYNIDRLEKSLQSQENHPTKAACHEELDYRINQPKTIAELRERLKNRLLYLYNNSPHQNILSPKILQSEPYNKLQTLISKGAELKENSKLWEDLESIILDVSPNFKSNLQLLVGGTLTSYDLHTCILIKCGIAPTQMCHCIS